MADVSPSNPIIICTGFHRSATSLVAQIMYAGGLHMGTRLVPSHLSNPDGHFEDAEAVTLGDTFLKRCGTDWRFHDEVPLTLSGGDLASLKTYIDKRDATHRVAGWGVKDPRISLFLPAWDQLLGDRARYLLVIRHWAASTQSLLNRHSRILVEHGSAQAGDREVHRSFWVQSGLAARMWIAYCSRILDFVQQHPERVLVLPQPLLMNGFEPNGWMNEHWGTGLSAPPSTVIKPDLLTDQVDDRLLAMLTPVLRSRLAHVWDQLIGAASKQLGFHLSDPQLELKWHKQESPLLSRALRRLERDALRTWGQPVKLEPSHESPWYELLGLDTFAQALEQCANPDEAALVRIVAWIKDHARDDGGIWQAYGEYLLQHGFYQQAEQAFLQSIALAPQQAAGWYHLGKTYECMEYWERAERHYQQAIMLEPGDPKGLLALAAMTARNGDFDTALSLLDSDLSARPRVNVARRWMAWMMEAGRHDEARARIQAIADTYPQHADAWNHLLAVLSLPSDAKGARSKLNARLRNNLSPEELPSVLLQAVEAIDSPAACRDLAWRMLAQWKDIYTEAEVRRAFS